MKNCIKDWGKVTKDTYRQVVAFLNEAGRYAATMGVRIALENHIGITSSVKGTLKILRGIESEGIGLAYDPANFYRYGENPLHALHRIYPHIVYMHLKDCRRGKEDYEFCDLGKGEIDWVPILESLSKTYDGYYAIEYEEPGDIMRGTRSSISFLNRYLGSVE